jgi:hypothetical protein
MATKTLHGIVRGTTIELDEPLDEAEGDEVVVQVKVVERKKRLPGPPPGWQPGSTHTVAGRLADSWTDEDDRILQQIYQDRRRETRRELPP